MANRITPTILKFHKFVKKWKQELMIGILFSSVLTASLITLHEQKNVQKIIERRDEKEQKLKEFRALVTQYPDSRDLLYRQAILEWELGNDEEASVAIDRARYLDPNNTVLPVLETLKNRSPDR